MRLSTLIGYTAFVCVLAVLLIQTGCAAAPEPPLGDGNVRIVQPDLPPQAIQEASERGEAVRWLVRRIAVRMEQPLAEAWAATDEAILPPISRAVWNGNGLRIGRLPARAADDFGQAVGEPVELRDYQLLSYAYPDVLRRSPPLAAEFVADLTVPPGPVYKETFTGGRLRLLLASRPLGNRAVRVTLTPQHFVPAVSLLPRDPIEKILDGRVFSELSIELDARPDQALVLGLFRPTDTLPPSDAPAADPATPPTQRDAAGPGNAPPLPRQASAEQPTPSEPEVLEFQFTELDPGPVGLGHGLLTTGLDGNDLQLLYLLRPLP
jgi:hypothetical protein